MSIKNYTQESHNVKTERHMKVKIFSTQKTELTENYKAQQKEKQCNYGHVHKLKYSSSSSYSHKQNIKKSDQITHNKRHKLVITAAGQSFQDSVDKIQTSAFLAKRLSFIYRDFEQKLRTSNFLQIPEN